MEPNHEQAQGLYRLCYRLTNVIYPGWKYRSVELIRIDERTGNLYVLAGNFDFEIKPTGGYERKVLMGGGPAQWSWGFPEWSTFSRQP